MSRTHDTKAHQAVSGARNRPPLPRAAAAGETGARGCRDAVVPAALAKSAPAAMLAPVPERLAGAWIEEQPVASVAVEVEQPGEVERLR